jgi:LuxR family maltose regulon positive regulatory protein
LLDDGQHSRLTVVIGGPGTGKTALLASWARERRTGTTAWLGLERTDNEPCRFRSRLQAALKTLHPALWPLVPEGLDEQEVNTAPTIDSLPKDVEPITSAALVLDNFEVIDQPAIVQYVERLVQALPLQLHAVVASRHEPGFPLHRLRLDGELTEIRDRHLRFTAEEAEAFLGRAASARLTPDQTGRLFERTEGWAAGLQLAVLSQASDPDPSGFVSRFDGHLDLVADYLDCEVLASQPPGVVEFLIQSSLLTSMTGELCLEVTGRPDSGDILHSLEVHNLLVSKVDGRDGWFRSHGLLRDLLRSRVEQEDPIWRHHAHLRAAEWLERQGDVQEAIRHFAQAGEYDRAFRLGASIATGHLGDGLPPDEPLLPSLVPQEYFEREPGRIIGLAAALLCSQQTGRAASWLNRLDQLVREGSAGDAFVARTEYLWALHDAAAGDAGGVVEHCKRATGLLHDGNSAGRVQRQRGRPAELWLESLDTSIVPHLAFAAARARLWQQNPVDARAALTALPGCEDKWRAVALPATRALVACSEGRLRETYFLARAALEEAEHQDRASSLVTFDALAALGIMFWEQGELDAASNHFHDAVRLCQSKGYIRGTSLAEQWLVRVTMSQGQLTDALDEISRLRRAERYDPLPDWLLRGLHEAEIGCRLALCDFDGAVRILESIPPERRTAEMLARIDLAAGRPDRTVKRLVPVLQTPVRPPVQVERLALLARARLQLGNRRQAEDDLRRAIDLSRHERYITRLVEQARELVPLLVEMAGRVPDLYLADVLAHAKRLKDTDVPRTPASTLEPLTDRERHVLTHLTGHLTQHEIASGMYVSVNTLKTHISRVYRKLGATSRSEAVALARAHGLV